MERQAHPRSLRQSGSYRYVQITHEQRATSSCTCYAACSSCEAKHQFTMSIVHIAGVDNDLADDLSRNQLPSFLQKAPQAQPLPTPIPPRLPEYVALLDTACNVDLNPTGCGSSWILLPRPSRSPPTRPTDAAVNRFTAFCALSMTFMIRLPAER